MKIFKSILIENFRGLSKLEVKDFADVNIFLGKNNIGKSTILESLFLICGMSNPENPQKVNSIRNRLQPSPIEDLKYIFHNMNTNVNPIFTSNLHDNSQRILEISIVKYDLENDTTNIISSNVSNVFNAVEVSFKQKTGSSEKDFTNLRFVGKNGLQNKIDNEYSEDLSGIYLPANLYDQNLNTEIANIIKNRRKEELLKILQEFDVNINTIESLPDGVFVGYNGIKDLVPVNMLGDGLRRFLCIVSAIANEENKVIFLDEVDNGIHYTAYKDLWTNIFILSQKFNKQLFITTHSKETLYALCEAASIKNDYQSMMSVFTIEKTDSGENKAYHFDYEDLKHAVENNIEIRKLI